MAGSLVKKTEEKLKGAGWGAPLKYWKFTEMPQAGAGFWLGPIM